jgi:hypothetical protein
MSHTIATIFEVSEPVLKVFSPRPSKIEDEWPITLRSNTTGQIAITHVRKLYPRSAIILKGFEINGKFHPLDLED